MKMDRLARPLSLSAASIRATIASHFPARGVRFKHAAATLMFCTALTSCAQVKEYVDFDTNAGVSKAQYEGLEGRRAPAPQPRGEEPPIPGFQSVLAAPGAPELADTRRVSIAVTESTPVRDILIELARKSQVDLELDPRISGGVIMTATDRPFLEVVGRITDLAELRYKYERNTLKVELDDPYVEQYRMDILNVSRTATSSAGSSTDAAASAQSIGTGGGASGNNKSATSVESKSQSDFWGAIGGNISQILSGVQSRRGRAAVTAAGSFVPEATKPTAVPAAPAGRPAGAAAAPAGAGGAGGLIAQAAGLGALQAQVDANAAADNKASTPAEPTLAAAQPGAPAAANGGPQLVANSQYGLNPDAGIITVFATQRQQKAVERYLRDVREALTQQVVIEAKVLEISLNDNYRAGIDWTAVLGPVSGRQNLNFATRFSAGIPAELITPSLTANWAGAILGGNGRNDLSLAGELVKQFGTVRTLSNPRLSVLNNQVAQLKVAQNQVFFQLQLNIADATATTAARTTVTSQIKTVPVGLIVSVQPAVDPITKRISLSLRPSITRITGFVDDPGVAVTVAVAKQNNSTIPTVTSQVPIIEVREMDSLVNLESGQTVVMGGLMQETASTSRQGVPGLMDIPLLGQFASQNIKQSKVTELVVFIRATLANAPGTVSDEDIRLYKTFTPDPRPVVF